jgi:hypothetical protein
MSSENQGSKDFGHEKRSKALQGAGTGAVVGAVVGAALAVAIAGTGPLAAAGIMLAGFAGAGAGGAVGWIAGLAAGFRLVEYVAKRYAGRIRKGGILMSVHCDDQTWSDRAKKALKATGARSISATAEAGADYGTAEQPTERAPEAAAARVEPLPPRTLPHVSHESRK